MIDLIGLLGLTAFVVASLVVGGRILLLARGTGGLAEITLGLSLALAGGVGTALAIAPRLAPEMAVETAHLLQQASSAINHLGYAFLFVFVWRVFRPGEAWAAGLFALSMLALLCGGAGIAWTLEPGQSASGSNALSNFWSWLSLGSRFVVYGWAAIESFRFHAMLKRRREIGLADEELVSRFFYWGICTCAVVLIWVTIAGQMLATDSAAFLQWASLVTAMLGFVVAGSLWIAFFPRRSAAQVAAAG